MYQIVFLPRMGMGSRMIITTKYITKKGRTNSHKSTPKCLQRLGYPLKAGLIEIGGAMNSLRQEAMVATSASRETLQCIIDGDRFLPYWRE